jgi:hypothetical protein
MKYKKEYRLIPETFVVLKMIYYIICIAHSIFGLPNKFESLYLWHK